MPTKEVMIAGTLEWCNSIRAEQSKDPLDELPKGHPANGNSCPCGAATGLFVGTYRYITAEEDRTGSKSILDGEELPDVVTQFVRAFDNHEIPELVSYDQR